jgi:hypothetical protein
MGLDMYLYAQKYESKTTWRLEEGENVEEVVKEFYPEDLQKIGLKHIKDNFLSKQTRYQIGYWRKFNALQHYFQNSVESDYELLHGIYVYEETIKELISDMNKILKDIKTCETEEIQVKTGWANGEATYEPIKVYKSKVALELLPPGDGFFYGSQHIDEWYIEDIKYSLKLFKEALKLIELGYDIIYEASW